MKKVLMFVLLLLLVLGGCGNQGVNSNEKVESNEEKESKYGEDLDLIVNQILENSSKAEEVVNTYAFIWNNSINSYVTLDDVKTKLGIEENKVREYFEMSGYGGSSNILIDDFNKNLASLSKYYSDTGKIQELESASEAIKANLKELNNPPETYKNAYNEVLEFYTLANEYIQLATNPAGSLITYNQSRNQLSTEVIGKFERIQIIMPEANTQEDN
ncbi:hypothetical protein [Sutcliffiella horikoshii]|uniref:hypothetical protein n=1 Tax=Sutcliffiella horikoshii TaxID=79883 RepID=UPI001F359739|nr:hypothetical protein [Sutcliffiella horikoshii]MCG1020788.1 hypothetical protein [Sutcliffiella horikoshii]